MSGVAVSWLRQLLTPRPRPPAASVHDKVRLCHAYEQLGPRSRRVLLLLADRLVLGQRDYGDFTQPRVWPLMRAEEQIDSAVYAAAEYLEQVTQTQTGGVTR